MAETAKKWTKAKEFDGMPKVSDFKLVEEPVSFNCKPGGKLHKHNIICWWIMSLCFVLLFWAQRSSEKRVKEKKKRE